MTSKDKIISCHGKVTAKSAAIMIGISINSIYYVWRNYGLEPLPRPRSFKAYMNSIGK